MRVLIVSNSVKRKIKAFVKRYPEFKSKLEQVIASLLKDTTGAKLRIHKLTGKLKNFYAASITYDYRLVFLFDDKNLYITNIGSHDEVY